MKKLLLYGFIGFVGLAFVVGGLRACFPKEDVKTEELVKMTSIDSVKYELERFKGGSFIDSVSLENSNLVLILNYNFETYKKFKPDSKIDSETYFQYFNSDSSIEKSLIDVTKGIYEKKNYIKSINYSVISENKIDCIYSEREEFIKFIEGKSNDEILYNDDFRKKIVEKFICKK